jgi:hypothetical protein
MKNAPTWQPPRFGSDYFPDLITVERRHAWKITSGCNVLTEYLHGKVPLHVRPGRLKISALTETARRN